MPIPTAPLSGASIATSWGTPVHLATFTPAGCLAEGAPVTMLAAEAYRDIPIDTPVIDPGTFVDVANDRIEIPTDGGGVYIISLECLSDGGATTGKSSIVLRRNGSEIGRSQEDNEGSLDVGLNICVVAVLDEGDLISVRGRQLGTGTLASIYVRRIHVVRIGYELGIAY
jgi:hypothetical protein